MLSSLLAPLIMLSAAVSPVASVGFILPHSPTAAIENVAAIAAREIEARSGARVVSQEVAAFTITLSIDAALPQEGFSIAPEWRGVRIRGADAASMLFGAGKFLRTSQFRPEGLTPSAWRGQSAPAGHFRAIYAATHFNNFYEAAPPEEVSQYLEELALWGANTVIVHFPTWQFDGFDDPAAQKNLEQTRRLLSAARRIGLKTGLIQCPNQGFRNAPAEVRAVPNPDLTKRHGNHGVNCCPSTKAGKSYLLDLYTRLFTEYKDLELDYLISWPYDEGGCGCDACAPWGANAFPELSKAVAGLARAVSPELQVILSTWLYDTPPAGEWEGLMAKLREDTSWLNGIMSDDHFDFPRYPLEHPMPAGLPLYNFPEISMWGRNPWGAYGANPLPARYEGLWKQTEGKLSGGMPYSEGIYEDMNKVICFQFYWNPDTTAEATLREYVAYEFSPEVVDEVLQIINLLEAKWEERGAGSVEAFQLLQQVDKVLPQRARDAWRWRVLFLRGLIDSELVSTEGKLAGDVLRSAFQELTQMYHADEAQKPVKPPVIP